MQVAEQVAQFGQRIRSARIRRGWSVADLANKDGVDRNTLTALELGKPGNGCRLARGTRCRTRCVGDDRCSYPLP